jgi:hypothetical protein
MLGFEQAHDDYGIEMLHEWVATLDSRTRDTHAYLHGERIETDGRFSNGLRYPHDPEGPPEEVINCRCTVVSVLKGLKESDAYRKLQERIGKKAMEDIDPERVAQGREKLEQMNDIAIKPKDDIIEQMNDKYKEIHDSIKNGKYPLEIEADQQNKHIVGTKNYNQYSDMLKSIGQYGPSRLNINISQAQDYINKYTGTGNLDISKKGKWRNGEVILVNDDIIGTVVNNLSGVEVETSVFKIKYGKRGTHMVPDYPSKKRV